MKKAIIIGATSGIGRELAMILSLNNYVVGMAGRRTELLSNLQREISGSYIKRIDVTKSEKAITLLKKGK